MRIARAANHRQAVGFREIDHGVVILLAGAEARGEFLDGKEMLVEGAGRIVELLQEIIQLCLIAQRQNNVDAHRLRCGKPLDELRLPVDSHFTHMTSQKWVAFALGKRCSRPSPSRRS